MDIARQVLGASTRINSSTAIITTVTMTNGVPHPSARWLLAYGTFLFCVALAAVMYDPKIGKIGFNPAAKTALISGGVCGGVSILWGLLLFGARSWPTRAAMVTTTLFLAAFVWRSSVSWMAVAAGASEKWYAGSLITLMAVASLALLLLLIRQRGGSRLRSSVP